MFLHPTMEHIGHGSGMQRWLDALYSKPSARVKVNYVLSDVFHIRNGTRQSCPLSPLIFILILEPFLRIIRDYTDIKGITTKSCQYKVAAYADNLIFFINSSSVLLPSLLSELCRYGQLSNYKINNNKSEAMGVKLPTMTQQQLKQLFKFKWTNLHV